MDRVGESWSTAQDQVRWAWDQVTELVDRALETCRVCHAGQSTPQPGRELRFSAVVISLLLSSLVSGAHAQTVEMGKIQTFGALSSPGEGIATTCSIHGFLIAGTLTTGRKLTIEGLNATGNVRTPLAVFNYGINSPPALACINDNCDLSFYEANYAPDFSFYFIILNKSGTDDGDSINFVASRRVNVGGLSAPHDNRATLELVCGQTLCAVGFTRLAGSRWDSHRVRLLDHGVPIGTDFVVGLNEPANRLIGPAMQMVGDRVIVARAGASGGGQQVTIHQLRNATSTFATIGNASSSSDYSRDHVELACHTVSGQCLTVWAEGNATHWRAWAAFFSVFTETVSDAFQLMDEVFDAPPLFRATFVKNDVSLIATQTSEEDSSRMILQAVTPLRGVVWSNTSVAKTGLTADLPFGLTTCNGTTLLAWNPITGESEGRLVSYFPPVPTQTPTLAPTAAPTQSPTTVTTMVNRPSVNVTVSQPADNPSPVGPVIGTISALVMGICAILAGYLGWRFWRKRNGGRQDRPDLGTVEAAPATASSARPPPVSSESASHYGALSQRRYGSLELARTGESSPTGLEEQSQYESLPTATQTTHGAVAQQAEDVQASQAYDNLPTRLAYGEVSAWQAENHEHQTSGQPPNHQ